MIDFSDLAASRSLAIAEAVGRLALRSGTALKPYSSHPMRRWAAVAALVAISGCSTFGGDVQKPSQAAAQASSNAAAKSAATTGSGQATAGAAAGAATSSATASASGATPDINSVPTTVPVPQDVSIEEVQPGLSADRTNAQYTDETLTAPEQSVARPAAPTPAAPAPAATPPASTQTAAAAAAPAAPGVPAPQAPIVSQQALPAPGQYRAPQMAPSGQVFQGYTGTPQPGSKPLGGGVSTPTFQQQQLSAVPQPSVPAMGGVAVDYSSVAAGGTYGYASYGAYQRQNPAQAYYRSPYGAQQTGYVVQPGLAPQYAQPQFSQPMGFQPYGQPVAVPPLPAAGQPVGIVYFNNGSARLSRDDSRVVKQVAEMHRYYGGVIRIVGHASQRTGNMDPYRQGQVNYEVSADRAQSIARALTQAGVPAGLVQVAAAGSANPVALETMPAGEANNRRVEIFLSAY
ncbi:OmpA family protein [Dongia sp.]|uniref:OmpA family protein n=1 Tax=Dongia sp. TaxID=1977262 RepID=UPI0035B3B31D